MNRFSKRFVTVFMVILLLAGLLPSTTVNIKAATTNRSVVYMPYAIGKGSYSTPIWDQHKIWKNGSSAANHGCGICVTAMALRLCGVNTDPNIVLKETKRSVKRCKALKAKKAAKYILSKGVQATCYNSRALSRSQSGKIMTDALNNGKLVMALVKGAPFSSGIHWILLAGYSKDGKVVVANSSYGSGRICRKTKKQYHLVSMSKIQSKLVRSNSSWSNFIVVNPKPVNNIIATTSKTNNNSQKQYMISNPARRNTETNPDNDNSSLEDRVEQDNASEGNISGDNSSEEDTSEEDISENDESNEESSTGEENINQ